MHIHIFERPPSKFGLVWMTYTICIIVDMVDIFVARRFDRHYCLQNQTFSQSQLMNEIGRPESKTCVR